MTIAGGFMARCSTVNHREAHLVERSRLAAGSGRWPGRRLRSSSTWLAPPPRRRHDAQPLVKNYLTSDGLAAHELLQAGYYGAAVREHRRARAPTDPPLRRHEALLHNTARREMLTSLARRRRRVARPPRDFVAVVGLQDTLDARATAVGGQRLHPGVQDESARRRARGRAGAVRRHLPAGRRRVSRARRRHSSRPRPDWDTIVDLKVRRVVA